MGASSLYAAFSDGVQFSQEPASCWDLSYRTCWHGGYEAYGALYLIRTSTCDALLAIRDVRRFDAINDWGLRFLPDGQCERMKPRFKLGFQLGIGAVFNNRKNDIEVTYTGIFTRDHLHVVPRDVQGIWLLMGHPRYLNLRLNNASVMGDPVEGALDAFANAKVAVNYNTLDVDIAARMCATSGSFVRSFLGIRWLLMSLAQDTHYEGTSVFSQAPGFSAQRHQRRSTAKSWGIGPRIGVQMRIPILCGLGVLGHLAGAVLKGEADLLVKEHHEITVLAGQENDVNQALEIRQGGGCQLIPAFDGRLALSYFRLFGDTFYLDAELGWVGLSYINAVTSNRFNNYAGTCRKCCHPFNVGGVFLSARIGV